MNQKRLFGGLSRALDKPKNYAIIKAEFEVNIASPNGNALRGLVTVEGISFER